MKLSEVRNGGLDERFNEELGELLENLVDPNTARDKDRKVVITLTVRPNEDRSQASMVWDVNSKLVPARPLTTFAIVERERGPNGQTRLDLREASAAVDENGEPEDLRQGKLAEVRSLMPRETDAQED